MVLKYDSASSGLELIRRVERPVSDCRSRGQEAVVYCAPTIDAGRLPEIADIEFPPLDDPVEISR